VPLRGSQRVLPVNDLTDYQQKGHHITWQCHDDAKIFQDITKGYYIIHLPCETYSLVRRVRLHSPSLASRVQHASHRLYARAYRNVETADAYHLQSLCC